MRTKGMVIAAAVVVVAGSVGVLAAGQVPNPIAYDTFCKLPDSEKKAAFSATTAENRGELVRTHLERWREANRARLYDKQLAYLAAMIESITSDSYSDSPEGEAARAKSRAIIESNVGLFTKEDMQAMQPNAPCIAKTEHTAGSGEFLQ